MKKHIFRGTFAILTLATLAMAAYMYVPQPKIGGDFDLRYNEIRCVLDGVDPFDVWSRAVDHAPYYPDVKPEMASERLTKRVNAYPPWAYTFGMPLAILPEPVAWHVYFALQLLFVIGIAIVGYRVAKAELASADDARLASAISLLLTIFAIGSCFQSGNYPLVVIAATLAMVACLQRGHDILAGFCWALAMIKPQMVLLYAIPLLMRRKFLTCAVATAVCLLASLPPMLLCDKGLLELIRHGIGASSHAFMGCGTLPGFLIPLFGQTLSINLGLAVGLAICLVMTLKTPRTASWLVFLTPAAFIGTAWTYSQLYASVMNWMPLLLISMALLRHPRSRTLWIVFVMSCLFLTRAYTFYHGFTMIFPERFGYPYTLHGTIDSVNSLLGLATVIWFWRISFAKENPKCDPSTSSCRSRERP